MTTNTLQFTVSIDKDSLIKMALTLNNLAALLPNKKNDDVDTSGPDTSAKVVQLPGVVADKTIEVGAMAPAAPAAPNLDTPCFTGVDLDSSGLPWDARIHAPSKKKLAKNQQWKKKRGVDPALVETVENELRAAMALPAGSTVAFTPENTNTAPAVTVPAPPVAPAPPAAPAAPIAPAPTAAMPTAPTPPDAPVEMTFPDFLAKLTNATTTGQLTQEQITTAVHNVGLQGLALLVSRPDLIPRVDAELFPQSNPF